MEVKLKDIALFINAEIIGDENAVVNNISPIEKAKKGDLTFIANKKYYQYLDKCNATAVILNRSQENVNINQIIVKDPYLAYAKILTFFINKPVKLKGISNKAEISENVKFKDKSKVSIYPFVYIGYNTNIGENVVIYPHVFIGDNVTIGNNVTVYSNVSIYKDTKIGNNINIHSGTVIGSDGYGYAKDGKKYFKIPQIGNVIIEDNVEIGANCTIDRGALNSTIIKQGTKLDNLVHIAHNVEIGENCAIVAQVGISGSSKIGDNVILAGQVGVAGHIKIGHNVMVGAQSGIGKTLPDNSIVSGSPAVPHNKWLKWAVTYQELPNAIKKIKKLEKAIEQLKSQISGDKND